MTTKFNGVLHFQLAFLVCAATLVDPLHADELTELYLNSSSMDTGSAIGPNILILLDTSGSMTKHGRDELGFTVDPEIYWGAPYDPNRVYPGPCDANTAYRKTYPDYDYDGDGDIDSADADRDGDGDIDEDDLADDDFQECDNEYNFPLSAVTCKAVLEKGFAADNFGEFRPKTIGPFENYMFDGNGDGDGDDGDDDVRLNGRWYSISNPFNGVGEIDGWTVSRECASDYGTHGLDSTTTYKWPMNTDTPFGWTQSSSLGTSLSGKDMDLVAAGNYINYFRWAQTRLAAVQAALREVIAELPPETRIGVMRFDVNGGDGTDGGYVIQAFVELGQNTLDANGNTVLSTNRQAIIERLYEIDPADDGGTPLGESLFEALLVYGGHPLRFGADAEAWNIDTSVWPWDENTTTIVDTSSVPASRDPANTAEYKSPIIFECQKNAVIFLSDGDPSSDTSVESHFEDMHNAELYGVEDCDDSSPNSCLREVADYMAHEDLLRDTMAGDQTVTTHTVGFGTDISDDGVTLLTEAAQLGGGTFTAANDYETLKDAFQVIFRTEIASNQTLSSPAVTVNAFNQMAHEDKLYFTMFDPALDSMHWPGNVKKYRLAKQDDGDYAIVDANDDPALNEDGSTIRYDAISYWTDPADPAIIANSGVDGNKTPLGGAAGASGYHEELYSWYGDGANTDLTDSDNAFNPSNITEAMVGLAPDSGYNDYHIWHHALGFDADDEDGDSSINEPTRKMGASPHGVPAVINYGTEQASATQVIYAPTNDGFLHAIDTETGADLWSFIPTEVMSNLADIYHPPPETHIAYGLDSSVIFHEEEIDGVARKWIFFGMRRGGRSIYALDVTEKLEPKLLWRIQGGDTGFERLAQSWSEPRMARINVDGEPTTVIVFGGGYDAATQDSDAASSGYVHDVIGNALYIVKADDGSLLWRAAPDGNLALSQMKSSIAAPVDIKDKNSDGLDDLIYAADLGGRIFRFDIDNYSPPGTLSVTGGMIASLGANGSSTAPLADNRKFFNEPDVVLAARDGLGYWAINIGSGDRERPKSNMATQNYLFSIKDPNIFHVPADYDYGITITNLYDATANDIQDPDPEISAPARAALLQSKGWMVALGHAGEKALAQARTFDFRVFFTTFDPTPIDTGSEGCSSPPGTARLYSLDLITAGAVAGDINNDDVISETDRETVLSHGTVPPAVTFMFLKDEETGEIEVAPLAGRTNDDIPVDDTGVVRRTFWNVRSEDEKEQ